MEALSTMMRGVGGGSGRSPQVSVTPPPGQEKDGKAKSESVRITIPAALFQAVAQQAAPPAAPPGPPPPDPAKLAIAQEAGRRSQII